MYNGILNVHKEAGFTSHDVVAKLRGICRQKKIGHTGTLDPEAVGVLPVCFGSGTKLCGMLTDWDKEYIATLRLGLKTDTQDMTGQVLWKAEEAALSALSGERAREALLSFRGNIMQTPPMHSALKVNGKKLYELARAGKEVERAQRPVEIKELEILELALPLVRFRVACSKGTYIRTLCHDIGEKLGVGGAMERLVRSRVGIFGLEGALTLPQIQKLSDENKISDVIISPDALFPELPAMQASGEAQKRLENGNAIPLAALSLCGEALHRGLPPKEGGAAAGLRARQGSFSLRDGEEIRVYDGAGQFCAIYRYQARTREARPVKMFL